MRMRQISAERVTQLVRRVYGSFNRGWPKGDDAREVAAGWDAALFDLPELEAERAVDHVIQQGGKFLPAAGDVRRIAVELLEHGESRRYTPTERPRHCPACHAKYYYAGFLCSDGIVRPNLRCVCKIHDTNPSWHDDRARAWRETTPGMPSYDARAAAQERAGQAPWLAPKVDDYPVEIGAEIGDAAEPDEVAALERALTAKRAAARTSPAVVGGMVRGDLTDNFKQWAERMRQHMASGAR